VHLCTQQARRVVGYGFRLLLGNSHWVAANQMGLIRHDCMTEDALRLIAEDCLVRGPCRTSHLHELAVNVPGVAKHEVCSVAASNRWFEETGLYILSRSRVTLWTTPCVSSLFFFTCEAGSVYNASGSLISLASSHCHAPALQHTTLCRWL
jgi:hypothetical protein